MAKFHYTNMLPNKLYNITNGHVATILQLVVQQVRGWLASNGQNFATSQHLDMSRSWDVVLPLTNKLYNLFVQCLTVTSCTAFIIIIKRNGYVLSCDI